MVGSSVFGRAPTAVRLVALAGLAVGVLVVRSVRDRGGSLRVASLLLHRLALPQRERPRPPQESRLYARRRRRLEAHLARFPDGRLAVLALPLDGSPHSSLYIVEETRPWRDFEHQAGLAGAPWGPCRSVNAGL